MVRVKQIARKANGQPAPRKLARWDDDVEYVVVIGARRRRRQGRMAGGKRKRDPIDPPEVGDRVSVKYGKWEDGVVTRVEGDEFWVAFSSGEEYAHSISIQRSVYKVRSRAREVSMVDTFVKEVGEVTPACALAYIRREGGRVDDALEL